jgi:hypothetical protein
MFFIIFFLMKCNTGDELQHHDDSMMQYLEKHSFYQSVMV